MSELPQWPLLQLIRVEESRDGKVLETLLVVNSLFKVLEYLVYNLRRRAPEAPTNEDIIRRFFLLSDPIIDCVCGVLCEAIVHLFLIQLDSATLNVPGTLRYDFSLVRHEMERDIVND